uniref:Uncharacterized protein n=1 Tax=Cajanus cajan TaxID=3821 RepID=A0A151QQ33_CAJCA|nr:hypothetical protein KK1_046928 [Cajanus cajan]
MPDRGRGGGRRPPNRGGRGHIRGRPPSTTNSPTNIHISTSKSTNPIGQTSQHALQEEHNPTIVGESVPATVFREDTPSTLEGSLTPEYPPPSESGHPHDQRPWLYAEKGEFTPANGPSVVISRIIRQKFDQPSPSWKKVTLDLRDRWFGEFKKEFRWDPQQEQAIRSVFETKGSRILKNSMNKVRNGQDNGTWIQASVRAALDQHWGSKSFKNKSSTAKANRAVDKGASTYCGGSISTATHYEKLVFLIQLESQYCMTLIL